MPKYYRDDSTLVTRAQQIYHILIGLAHNRQTIRYGDLGTLIDYGAGRGSVLAGPTVIFITGVEKTGCRNSTH